jgi:hypothetical protein
MRIVATQAFRRSQSAPEASQTRQHFIRTWQATHLHLPVVLYQIDLVAFFEAKLADKVRGQADGKRVTPFRDLHLDALEWMYGKQCISHPTFGQG